MASVYNGRHKWSILNSCQGRKKDTNVTLFFCIGEGIIICNKNPGQTVDEYANI